MRRFGEFADPVVAGTCVALPPSNTEGSSTRGPVDDTSTPVGDDTSTPVGDDTDVTDDAGFLDVSMSTSSTGESPDLDDDPALIAWFEFESDPGRGVLDSSGNGLDGVCAMGQCPTLEPGVLGQAIHLDGVDDAIIADMPATFDSPQEWTVAAWLRRDAVASGLSMAFCRPYGSGSRNTYEIYFHDWTGNAPPLLHLGVTTLSGDDRIAAVFESPVAEWMHVAGTWDGQLIRLWIDGLPVASRTLASVSFDDHDLLIGVDQNGENAVSNHFEGSLDDLRIYGRALSAEEIGVLASVL